MAEPQDRDNQNRQKVSSTTSRADPGRTELRSIYNEDKAAVIEVRHIIVGMEVSLDWISLMQNEIGAPYCPHRTGDQQQERPEKQRAGDVP
jgi:hypothetical protein